MIAHPFESIPPGKRRQIFLPLFIATVLIFIAWVLMVSPMSNDKAPLSVSSFGMAGSLQNAREMMASWDEPTRLSGAFGIGFDFLQLVIYPITVALACAWIAQKFRRQNRRILSNLGFGLAWGQWLAVIFGTIQNAVMMSLLLRFSISEIWMQISYWSTLFKLIFLAAGPAFAALGYFYFIVKGDSERNAQI